MIDPGAMSVRPMVCADMIAVLEHERDLFTDPMTQQQLASALDNQDICLVAELSGRVVGHLLARAGGGEADLLTIAMARQYQRRGGAALLLRALLPALRDTGIEKLFLEVRESNHAAASVYRTAGFVATGRRKNYYQAGTVCEDALLFVLDLHNA